MADLQSAALATWLRRLITSNCSGIKEAILSNPTDGRETGQGVLLWLRNRALQRWDPINLVGKILPRHSERFVPLDCPFLARLAWC